MLCSLRQPLCWLNASTWKALLIWGFLQDNTQTCDPKQTHSSFLPSFSSFHFFPSFWMQTNWKKEYFWPNATFAVFPLGPEGCSRPLPWRRESRLLTLTLLEAGGINKRNKFLVTAVPAADTEGGRLEPLGDRARCDATTAGLPRLRRPKRAWVSRGQRSAVLRSVRVLD